MFALAFHANLGDLEPRPYAHGVVLWLPWLHIHGGRYKALAARHVGGRQIVVGGIQVIGGVLFVFVDVVISGRVVHHRRGAAVQRAGGLLVQVLQG